MKCYNCGRTITNDHTHCDYCGVLLKPTAELIERCRNGEKKAIAQLYKISYLQIYSELLIAGVGREEGKRLINRAFRALLKQLFLRDDVAHFDRLVRLVSRKAGESYLEHFQIEPLAQPYEDLYFEVTDEMIEDLFDYLQKRKPVTATKKKQKRKVFQWNKKSFMHLGILGGIVVALLIASSLLKYQNNATANKKRDATYVTIVKQYQKGMSAVTKSNDPANLASSYPTCSAAISMAYARSIKTSKLCAYIMDVDGDGHDDLLLGFKEDNTMFVTGLYMNNDLNASATNTNAITGTTQEIIITKDHQVIRNDSGTYHLLTLNGKDQYVVKKTLDNLATYLEKCDTSKQELTGLSINRFLKTY
jgi:predicted amidophosphoribosyltransferase